MKKMILMFAVAVAVVCCKNIEPEMAEQNNTEVVPGQTISLAISSPNEIQSNDVSVRKIYGNMTAKSGISFVWEDDDNSVYVTSLDKDGKPAVGAEYTSEFTLAPKGKPTEPRIFTGDVPKIPEGGKKDMFLISCGPTSIPETQIAYSRGIGSNVMRFEAYSSLNVEEIKLKPVWSFVQLQSHYVYNMQYDEHSEDYGRDNMELNTKISQVKLTEYIYNDGETDQSATPIETIEITYKNKDNSNFDFTTKQLDQMVQPVYNFVVKPAKTYSLVFDITYVSASGTGYNGTSDAKTDLVTYAPKRQVNEYPEGGGTITYHQDIPGVYTMQTRIVSEASLDSAFAQNMKMKEEMITWIPAEAWPEE